MRPRYDVHEDSNGFSHKHLLFGRVEKVMAVGSYSRATESFSKEEAYYFNSQGIFGTTSKKTKVETIKEKIIMKNLVILIVIKGIGRIRMIEVGCMCLQAIMIILQMTLGSFLWKL